MNELPERWTPGRQQGEVVRVLYTIPVTFKLEDSITDPKQEGTDIKIDGQLDADQNLKALIIIDGIELHGDVENLDEYIDPQSIKEISVIKGEEAIEKYGDKGQNGVVNIILKKGAKFARVPMDTVIIYDPETFTETVKLVPRQGANYSKEGVDNYTSSLNSTDTIIIYDPETYSETIIISEPLDEDFLIELSYNKDIVTLTSSNAAWTNLSFPIKDNTPQIIDEFGMAEIINHKAQFSFMIVKNGIEFRFKNHHGFNWPDPMGGSCGNWDSDVPRLLISNATIHPRSHLVLGTVLPDLLRAVEEVDLLLCEQVVPAGLHTYSYHG